MKVENETKDITLQKGKKNSRRSILKKSIIGVPAVMALAHRPAFGAVCTLSGFQSVNPSGVARHETGCGGISPGGWKQNGYKVGNMDGNRLQWIACLCYPNPRIEGSLFYNVDSNGVFIDDQPGTLFYDIFVGITPSVPIASDETLHDVLLSNPGSLEFHVISNVLNSIYYGWGNNDGKMPTSDIIGVYSAYLGFASSYTTSRGSVVDLNNFDLQAFLAQLYH